MGNNFLFLRGMLSRAYMLNMSGILLTINAPLILKMRDIIVLLRWSNRQHDRVKNVFDVHTY
jgi:hypothetical protein